MISWNIYVIGYLMMFKDEKKADAMFLAMIEAGFNPLMEKIRL